MSLGDCDVRGGFSKIWTDRNRAGLTWERLDWRASVLYPRSTKTTFPRVARGVGQSSTFLFLEKHRRANQG